MSKREWVRNFLRFRFLRNGGKSKYATTIVTDYTDHKDSDTRVYDTDSATKRSGRAKPGDSESEPTQPTQHATEFHQIPASDRSGTVDGTARTQNEHLPPSLNLENITSEASVATATSVSVVDQALSQNDAQSQEGQQPPAHSTPTKNAVQPLESPRHRPADVVYSNQVDHRHGDGLDDDLPSPPKITVRTNTFDSTRTLDPPEHGQPSRQFQPLPSVRTSLGLDPGLYRHSPLRYQDISNIAQPLLDETPKLKRLFPMTIPVRCHICFNTNHQMQRLLTDAVLDSVPAPEDDDSSFETDVIELPDQEIEWYKDDAYESLRPKGHMYKILQGHSDVPMESLYTRHGCFRVEGPPELRQNLKYARFEDVTELAQKSIHAICGFIHEHKYERFHLDVFWEYSTLQLSVPQQSGASSFHEIVKEGLKSKLVTNFRGQQYIPRCDLIMFQQPSVMRSIISQDESIDDEDRDVIRQLAVSKATHLLLMYVYVGRPIKTFQHLVEVHDINDGSLENMVGKGYRPLHEEKCQRQECLDTIDDVYKCAPEFLPMKVGNDPRFEVWENHMVIPLHFYDNKKPLVTRDANRDSRITGAREIGRGANGHVLEVWAEPSLHNLPGSLQQTFALKKASSIRPTAFEAEKMMLEKLYDYPHGHITPHFGSWQQDDHNYILLPRAKCNLRDYLTSVRPPDFKMNAVKWFFDQLYGLADAIKHVHHIKPESTLMNPEPADLSYGYHHDIKPENILVFEKVANTHPVLQIADFGAGSLYDADANKVSRPPENMRGTRTYFSPDGDSATRPVDLWSLGCCFLELTLWLFKLLDPAHNREPFTQERKYFPGYNPDDTDDGFWYRREDGKIELKEPVIGRIDELRRRYCKDMEVFQILLNAIRRPDGQKSLLTIDKGARMDAPTLVDCLNIIRKHIDLQIRTASTDDEDDLYARHFTRNVNSPDQALTPIIPMKMRTTLTTDPQSSPRTSFLDDEPTTPASLHPRSGRRHRSMSSLVLQAGQGTEPQAEVSSHDVNEENGRASSQTLSSPKDSLEQEIERLELEN